MFFHFRNPRRWCLTALMGLFICLLSFTAAAETDPSKLPLGRKGVVMGLDPGLALRFNEYGTPLYARMNLRIGGCFNPRVQLGVDWRMEILVSGEEDAWLTRHEIGPVATFFLIKGWFLRSFAHVGALQPFVVTAGLATGYEWGMGRFSGAGIAVGGDVDILFNGNPPPGYSIFFNFYLTAYDLKTRRGRNHL